VLNPATGELEPPDPDTTVVYDDATIGDGGRGLGARCKVTPKSEARPIVTLEGGTQVLPRYYDGSIPWDAPAVYPGDVLTITSSRRDPQLVGKSFRVRESLTSTMLVARRLVLELR
jgi:hypothetical protein